MQFLWNDDTIRWYINANDYTGFFKHIAETVRPMLAGYTSLCDLGCGLALFDFEIARYLDRIDCFDLNEAALSSVNERVKLSGIRNITAHLKDCKHLSGACDVVFMSFFGSRKPDVYLKMCKKLIAVVGITEQTEIFPSAYRRHRKNTVNETIHYLDRHRIPYKLTYHQLEFGQPFTSITDARHFVRTYSPGIPDDELEEFLVQNLTRTGRNDYPLYIPRTKSVGIFELNGQL